MIPALLALFACQADVHPAPVIGSSYRIDDDNPADESEIFLEIFTHEQECANAGIDELDICRPMVDRAAAEVHLSFEFRDRETFQNFPLALAADDIKVLHDRVSQTDFELIPHRPRAAGQVYVVIIDGSGSMYEEDGLRIKKVRRALLSREVVEAFYPPDANGKTGVVLLRFNEQLQALDGGEPRVIRRPDEYRRVVREHILDNSGGYTHLYDAITNAMGEMMRLPRIQAFMDTHQAQPTFIALTDGFNNEAASDTCESNVPRLDRALAAVKKARKRGGFSKPTLYTIGLGRKYQRQEMPEGLNKSVTADGLCGRYAGVRIDGNLEREGIDHISLAWLAETGGGLSFVREKYRGVAEVFLTAAAKRYEWFEVKYRVKDNIFHRQSFDVGIELKSKYRSRTDVMLHPNPWFDGPPATLSSGENPRGWHSITSLRHALVVLMPVLGVLVFLNFLGAASFNARRGLFRRARPRRRS